MRRYHALALCLLAASAASVSAAASAQPAPSGYRELLAEGVVEFDEGNFDRAGALFAKAHALYPNARTLRGMGLSAFEASQYAIALVHLRAALAEQAGVD